MRLVPRTLSVLGLLLIATAGLWSLVAPKVLVKFPVSVDQSFRESGDVTLYSAGGAPLASPATLPLNVGVNLTVVGHAGDRVTVRETQKQDIGSGALKQPTAVRTLQYVFDRRSMKNAPDLSSFAFTPPTIVDRSPNYAVNFPLHTGNGPYPVWKDETGTAFPMRKIDTVRPTPGATLSVMQGKLSGVPVRSYFMDSLPPAFVSKQLTLTQLGPSFKVAQIIPTDIATFVRSSLTATDNAAVAKLLTQPVRMIFLLSATTTMAVEPTTGVIVSDSLDETISTVPDTTQLNQFQAILTQPRYSRLPDVTFAAGLVAGLTVNPPVTQTLRIHFASTPPSVASVAAFANHLRAKIVLVESTVPWTLTIAGGALLAAAVVMRLTRRRNPPAQVMLAFPKNVPSGPQPAASSTAAPRKHAPAAATPSLPGNPTGTAD
jgi:Porin PorA